MEDTNVKRNRDFYLERARDLAIKVNKDISLPYYDRIIIYPELYSKKIKNEFTFYRILTNIKKFVRIAEGCGLCDIDSQYCILRNYFKVINSGYLGRSKKKLNPFITTNGFNAALIVLNHKLLRHCIVRCTYNEDSFRELLDMNRFYTNQIDAKRFVLEESIEGIELSLLNCVIKDKLHIY